MTRYVLFSDMHGRDVAPIEDMLQTRKVDAGICLGDFDRAYIALQVKELQENYELHVIPGNHDYSHMNKDMIYSGTMDRQGITSQVMWKEWEDDREARDYVQKLLNNPTIELEISGNKTLAIHGGLSGEFITEPAKLWNRIRCEADYMANFREMEKQGIKIMLRGHDHNPQFARVDPESGFKEYVAARHGFNMFNKRIHIVNPGAFYNGNYAIITADMPDRENPTVEFCQL